MKDLAESSEKNTLMKRLQALGAMSDAEVTVPIPLNEPTKALLDQAERHVGNAEK